MALRVQIPAYTDRWMMGDRYGEVTHTLCVRRGRPQAFYCVRLDKSRKVFKFIADDCTVVD